MTNLKRRYRPKPKPSESESGFQFKLFGTYNSTEIKSIVDKYDNYWFTQETVANALEMDKSSISRIRTNHPSEFTENDDYMTMTINSRNTIVYSEEGFLTVCDMANTEAAFRLRKWMRKQFKVRQKGDEISILTKTLPRDDLSDLGTDLVLLQSMLDSIATNRRQIRENEKQLAITTEKTNDLYSIVEAHEERIQKWEEGAKQKPGELSATQLAKRIGWVSSSGAPHNLAVITAAYNAEFDIKGLMQTRREEAPAAHVANSVEVQVFTEEGIEEFISQIDSQYNSGQSFTISPTERTTRDKSHKNNRHVLKV